jgi:DNA-binding transcriptional LysR family regulator
VELTPEGRDFKGSLAPLIRELHQVFEQSKERMSKPEGVLSFSCYPEIGQHFFMRILMAFQKEHPGIDLRINFALDSEMIQALKSGETDFAVLSHPVIAENLRSYRLLDERSVAVTRASNKNDFPTRFEDLQSTELIGYNRRDELLFDFLKAGFKHVDFSKIRRFTTVNSHKAMLDLLMARDSFAVIPYFSVEEALRQKKLRLAAEREFRLTFYLVHPESTHLSKKNEVFRTYLIDACKKKVLG